MQLCMLAFCCQQQVFDSVVCLNTVDVVNLFLPLEPSPYMLSHNPPMLSHTPIRCIEFTIAVRSHPNPALIRPSTFLCAIFTPTFNTWPIPKLLLTPLTLHPQPNLKGQPIAWHTAKSTSICRAVLVIKALLTMVTFSVPLHTSKNPRTPSTNRNEQIICYRLYRLK